MHAEPYIRRRNLYFVPIIRNRLAFALLVQRAVQELDLEELDAIAVELPNSVGRLVSDAVHSLPTVSLVVASEGPSSAREVFPVTPADGVIEAIRIAQERRIPLEFIDAEIPPGNLVDRECMADPDWPDDGLALLLGAPSYFQLVARQVAQPPVRIDPLDTWRESHMTRRLRRLHLWHRRVLVVCDMVRVEPVTRQLGRAADISEIPDLPVGSVLQTLKPTTSVLLRYLDDVPKVVEQYDAARRQGKGGEFDKTQAILRTVSDAFRSAEDLHLSVRSIQIFSQLLRNVSTARRRVSPRLEEILDLSRACFNDPFVERLRRKLLSYGDQVEVDRVAISPAGDVARSRVDDRSDERVFVARNCNPFPTYATVRSVPRNYNPLPTNATVGSVDREVGPSSDGGSDWMSRTWSPHAAFINQMRRKAYRLAERQHGRTRSYPFRGSLMAGVDPVQTMRAYRTGNPELYVRARIPLHRAIDANGSPIVMLLDLSLPRPGDRYDTPWCGYQKGKKWVNHFLYCGAWSDRLEGQDPDLRIWQSPVLGVVSYCDTGLQYADLEAMFGDRLPRRLPSANHAVKVDNSWIVPQALDAFGVGAPWWEVLLSAAVRCADRSIVIVAQANFRVPLGIFNEAAARDVEIVRVALGRFTEEEQRKLRSWYIVTWRNKGVSLADDNDPEGIRVFKEAFGAVMRPFWGDDR